MLELMITLAAAAVFAACGVSAENRGDNLITGCCVAGCIVTVITAGIQVVFMLIAVGWQP